MKNILVFGATGMAGHIVSLYLKENGYRVSTFTRKSFKYCDNIVGDATDLELVNRVIQYGNYDIVINCIGLLNSACDKDPDNAVFLNSFFPHYLCKITKNLKTRIIHISTDCVFSGKLGPYKEDSFKDGESFYDRSKALGELNDNKNLTFRNSIIGPDMNINGIGLFNWFMKQKVSVNGYSSVLWTGVTTITLAKAIDSAIKEDITGVYNLVNNTCISKYKLLQYFNDSFNRKLIIREDNNIKTKKILINTRKDFSFIVPSYENMIEEMRKWIFNHKELYPHYFL